MLKLLALLSISLAPQAKPMAGTKTVTITCGHGQTSGASGTYGGVPFDVFCHNGNDGSQAIAPTGTVWTTRIGVEDKHAAFDCAFNGDSETVSVNCVGTTLTIQ